VRQTKQSVVVLERNELVSAASSLAAGLLIQVTGKKNNTPLATLTRQTIASLEKDSGHSTGFHESGSLRITDTEASAKGLDLLIEEAKKHHIPAKLINAHTARKKVPWLDTSNIKKVAHFPTDGYIDPYLLSMAYIKGARQKGACFQTKCAVDKILHKDGKVIGVSTSNGKLYGSTVVNAAGAWSSVLSADAGFPLPLVPVRSHYWIAEPDPHYGGEHPITLLHDAAAYTRPETGGLLLGVQETNSKTFDARQLPHDSASFSLASGEAHWDTLIEASDAISKRFPGIHKAQFSNYLSGLSTYTPDGQLILGEIPGVEGLFAASGCCGSGIALSAGIGKSISSLMINEDPPFNLSPFRPDRFGCINPFSEQFRQSCADARSNKIRPGTGNSSSG